MLLAGPGQRPSVEDGGRRVAGYCTFGRVGMPAICGGWEGASTLGKERERWNALQTTEHAAQEFALKDKKFWNSFTFWKGHFLGRLCKQRYQHHQQRYHLQFVVPEKQRVKTFELTDTTRARIDR